MAQPDKYWDKRAIKRLTDTEKQSEKYIARIHKMYDRANRNIQRDIEDIYRNYSKATGLDTQKLKELLTASETDKLWKEMQRRGLDKYVKKNYKARISRLEKLQAQVYAKAKEVYPEEVLQNTMCYEGVINNSYYRAIYDAQMGIGADFAFSKIDDNMMTALLNENWSGANYSQRIWGNTDLLAESLSEIIGGAMMSGQSIQKTSRQIRERFNVSKYYADRLVRTETNHFNNEADAMAYEEMDVDKYVFLATLDTRTSTICQEMDYKVFDLKDRQVGVNFPPMHPNCRSKTRAYMGEEIEKTMIRRARNPVTGKTELVGNISYQEWAEQHGLNSALTNSGKSGTLPMYRKSQNKGAFAELPERMSRKHIRSVAAEYGIDLSGITINIDKNEELLRTKFTGRADPEKIGSITFFPKAFRSKEELVRTIFHEKVHTEQFRTYGVEMVQNNRAYFEKLAEDAEDEFVENLKRKGVSFGVD